MSKRTRTRRVGARYFFGEGVNNIFCHGFMSFVSVGIIAACLLITGCFSLIAVNIDAIVVEISEKSEISVFVDETYTEEEARALEPKISAIPYVSEVTFVSKDQALAEYKEDLGSDGQILEGLEEDNPLRDGFRIRMADLNYYESIAEELAKIEGVASVESRADISQKLISVRKVVDIISIVLVVMLGAVSVFIIYNTVKLATFTRKEEIAIMKMVGATNGFVRWPFIIEGLIIGELGAIVAFVLQWVVYKGVARTLSANLSFVSLIPFNDLIIPLLPIMLVAGLVIGAGGSMLAIRKFLKV